MAQLLLMLIHLQQLRKLCKAIQRVTHMPIPRYEYRKCLEYSLTEDSTARCRAKHRVRSEKKKKKIHILAVRSQRMWMQTHSDGHIVKVMRLSRKH